MEPTKVKSNTLYSGKKLIYIARNKRFSIHADKPVTIKSVNMETGEETIHTLKQTDIYAKSTGLLSIQASDTTFWTIEYQDEEVTKEQPDPVPKEAAIQAPLSTLERMRQLIHQEVVSRYGENQIETLEEAMDFDINGDGEIGLTPHEAILMQEENIEPVTPEPTTTAEPTPSQTEETPVTPPPA